MKKAILITGLIWMVLCLGLGIFEIIYGAGDLVKVTSESGAAVIDEDVVRGVANIVLGVWLLAGAVLSLIMVLKRNSDMGKGAGITLGVFGIIFGAELPGIFFIVDSAKNRQ